jgi:tripartite-type tricarboxylate transporter receptor subunit TctC
MCVRVRCSLFLLALALTAAACSSASGVTPADEAFRGRTLRIVVGSGAGGGYDTVARLLAAFLGRHLPGAPTIVVDNMSGAGGLIAADFLARRAPRDGLTLGYIGDNAVLAQLADGAGARYDVRAFGIVGAPTGREADVCVMSRESGLDLEGWRTAGVPPRLAVTSVRSGPYARSVLLSTALELPVRFVVGYQGTAEIRLAMSTGEVEGMCTTLSSYLSVFEPKADYPVVLQEGDRGERLLDGVPMASDLVRSAEGRERLDLAARMRELPRYLVVPPDTPPDRLALLQAALEATVADPLFVQAAAAVRVDVTWLPASDVSARVNAVLDLPAEARARLTALLSEEDVP